MENDQKAHGWLFTAEVNHPLSRQLSRTEALTHELVSWDFRLAVYG